MTVWPKFKEHTELLYRRFKHTCGNLTVHGPSFLARKDVHFVYKVIYFLIYVQIWIAAVATIRRYYNHYQENTIRFTTRTDYLEWNTTFASVTVCEIANVEKIWMISNEVSNDNFEKFDRFIGDIAFFSGTCYTCLATCDFKPICSSDFTQTASMFRTPCKDFFLSCKWNGRPIDCCKQFKPLATEYGTCFSINNKNVAGTQIPLVATSNRRIPGELEITTSQDYEAFIHSPEDVPFWNMEYDRRIRIVYGSQATVTFTIMDVVNEPEVSLIAPETRQCRFSDETPENILAFKHYSYSVCITQCRIDAQLRMCNCTHHLSPIQFKDHVCDFEGLKCLTNNYKTLGKLKVPGTNEAGLVCNCLPSCIEPDYNVISKKLSEPEKFLRARPSSFIMGSRPYQRVTRQVARTTLDLVVAMGNCFGLCFGGSLLSIAEVVYYLCFKRWKYVKDK
uniref:Uncharacterized protein n=1 Tax=Bombyx mori TaxID=7091 RepID=A0A8R2HQD0_BOMMO|nr:sodium channel protein Nach-like [Bombyx mori]